jgi:hypothetical protein
MEETRGRVFSGLVPALHYTDTQLQQWNSLSQDCWHVTTTARFRADSRRDSLGLARFSVS